MKLFTKEPNVVLKFLSFFFFIPRNYYFFFNSNYYQYSIYTNIIYTMQIKVKYIKLYEQIL